MELSYRYDLSNSVVYYHVFVECEHVSSYSVDARRCNVIRTMAQSGLEFAEIARHPIFEDIDITPWTVRRHALGENFSCGDCACDSDVQPVKAPQRDFYRDETSEG